MITTIYHTKVNSHSEFSSEFIKQTTVLIIIRNVLTIIYNNAIPENDKQNLLDQFMTDLLIVSLVLTLF